MIFREIALSTGKKIPDYGPDGDLALSINRRQFINKAIKGTGLLAAASVLSPRLLQAAQPPAIFYSPHEDDEAIGMTGAIQETEPPVIRFIWCCSPTAQIGPCSGNWPPAIFSSISIWFLDSLYE